jgi:nicotinamidase-related amidase
MQGLKTIQGASSVHLCIDMQKLFAPDGPWATPWMGKVLPKIIPLIERSPERTIFTRFIPPKQPEDMPGRWQDYYNKWRKVTGEHLHPSWLELVLPLQIYVPPAGIFDRLHYSAFMGGYLHSYLTDKNINTLIISGAETDVCVLCSVLSAVDLGYRVVIAEDGICSSSDESHDALLKLYNYRFDIQIELASTLEILDCWKS